MGSTKVNMPEERSLAAEGRETLETQIQLAPALYAARSSPTFGDPAYQRLQMRMLEEALFGRGGSPQAGAGTTGAGAGAGTTGAGAGANPGTRPLQPSAPIILPRPTQVETTPVKTKNSISSILNPFSSKNPFRPDNAFLAKTPEMLKDMSKIEGGDPIPGTGGYSDGVYYPTAEDEYAPGILDIMARSTPVIGGIEAAANTQRRSADVADIERLGPRIQQALRDANPEQYALLDRLQEEAMGAGPTEIELRLREQALAELGLGGRLSGEQERLATQDARQAFSDRGMLRGNASMSAEVLNRYAVRDAREQQRRQFAGQVAGLERSGMGMDRGFRAQVTGMWGAATADPMLAITGRPSTAPNTAMAQQGAAGASYGQTAGYFNPFSSYASDLYNTNYNAKVNAAIANANNSTAITGAAIGAVGSIAGGAMMCWVAREAYGERSGRWIRFRHLMLSRMPALAAAYAAGGRKLAAAMRANSDLRACVTGYLDRILDAYPQPENT
jgi:hypothetical protein